MKKSILSISIAALVLALSACSSAPLTAPQAYTKLIEAGIPCSNEVYENTDHGENYQKFDELTCNSEAEYPFYVNVFRTQDDFEGYKDVVCSRPEDVNLKMKHVFGSNWSVESYFKDTSQAEIQSVLGGEIKTWAQICG